MPPLTDEMLAQARSLLLFGILPALGVAALLMAAIALLFRGKQPALAAALALIAGAGLGYWLRDTLRLTNDDSDWNRLPWAALGALWVGRVARFPELQPSAGWILRAATSIAIAWLVMPLPTRTEFTWLAPAFAATVLGLWALLERLSAEPPDGSVPFCVALAFVAAGAVLLHAGIGRSMEACIMLAAALTGIAIASWCCNADPGGAMPAVAVLLPGMLLMGQRESAVEELAWYIYVLPAFAPFLLAEMLPTSQWQTIRLRLARFLLMLILILIPLATALYLAEAAAPLDFEGM